MPILTYATETNCYVLNSDTPALGQEYCLTTITSPDVVALGGYSHMTTRVIRQQRVPVDNPYAVLPLMQFADDEASARLLDLWLDYELSFATESQYDPPCPPGHAYLPYQKAGIWRAVKLKRILIGDEPGLGKTVQGIGTFNAVPEARSALVICPASLRLQWEREWHEWCIKEKGASTQVFLGTKGQATGDVVFVSYEGVRNPDLREQLLARKWDLLILDEAHKLKDVGAKQTQAVLGTTKEPGIASRAERIVALTGTPLPNRPNECFALVRILNHAAIDKMSAKRFKEYYDVSVKAKNGAEFTVTGHLHELQARLRAHVMVRRSKASVLKDLPDKRYALAYVESTTAIQKVLEAERLLDIDPDDMENLPIEMEGHIARVRKEMGIAKAPLVIDHLRNLFDGGTEKVVCFAFHTEVVRLLEEAFPHAAVVSGKTRMVDREAEKTRFQTDPKCKLFIGQLTAAGTGIDGLQNVCSHAVFAEASWTPGENEQCGDRIHRFGQKLGVLLQFLVAAGSLDERILKKCIEKLRTTNKALDARFVG